MTVLLLGLLGRKLPRMRWLVPKLRLEAFCDTGLETGRDRLKMRSVALCGPKVRKSPSNFTDPTDRRNVWLFRDCSISSILNQKRRLKAVLDFLDGIEKFGISLTTFLELGAQWDKVLSIGWVGPLGLVPSSLMTLFSGLFKGHISCFF